MQKLQIGGGGGKVCVWGGVERRKISMYIELETLEWKDHCGRQELSHELKPDFQQDRSRPNSKPV